jgi:hypothetical protein
LAEELRSLNTLPTVVSLEAGEDTLRRLVGLVRTRRARTDDVHTFVLLSDALNWVDQDKGGTATMAGSSFGVHADDKDGTARGWVDEDYFIFLKWLDGTTTWEEVRDLCKPGGSICWWFDSNGKVKVTANPNEVPDGLKPSRKLSDLPATGRSCRFFWALQIEGPAEGGTWSMDWRDWRNIVQETVLFRFREDCTSGLMLHGRNFDPNDWVNKGASGCAASRWFQFKGVAAAFQALGVFSATLEAIDGLIVNAALGQVSELDARVVKAPFKQTPLATVKQVVADEPGARFGKASSSTRDSAFTESQRWVEHQLMDGSDEDGHKPYLYGLWTQVRDLVRRYDPAGSYGLNPNPYAGDEDWGVWREAFWNLDFGILADRIRKTQKVPKVRSIVGLADLVVKGSKGYTIKWSVDERSLVGENTERALFSWDRLAANRNPDQLSRDRDQQIDILLVQCRPPNTLSLQGIRLYLANLVLTSDEYDIFADAAERRGAELLQVAADTGLISDSMLLTMYKENEISYKTLLDFAPFTDKVVKDATLGSVRTIGEITGVTRSHPVVMMGRVVLFGFAILLGVVFPIGIFIATMALNEGDFGFSAGYAVIVAVAAWAVIGVVTILWRKIRSRITPVAPVVRAMRNKNKK